MANFGWAYVDCDEITGDHSGSFGPAYSLQFVTESGGARTTGSIHLTFRTGSPTQLMGATLMLTGTLAVSGTISASHYEIHNIATIDSTGSTYFGNSNDDRHIRTGSLTVLSKSGGLSKYILSASNPEGRVWVRGFGGNYKNVSSSPYWALKDDYIMGVSNANDTTIYLPSASLLLAGATLIIKDQVASRPPSNNRVRISASSTPGGFQVDNSSHYTLQDPMGSITLYSNGSHWFVV